MTLAIRNPHAPIDLHVPCLGCGYDLYASPRAGLCPECGRDVTLSVEMAGVMHDPINAACARQMSLMLLISSFFAGLCPAACLLMLSWEHVGGAVLMTIAFAACAVSAALGERNRLQIKGVPAVSGSNGAPFVPDLIAGIGLFLINAAGYLYAMQEMRSGYSPQLQSLGAASVGFGFFLLCATAWRALPTWKAHADIARLLQRKGLAKLLNGLAYAKAVYETLWLACCWTPFAFIGLGSAGEGLAIPLAVAAAFGLIGFAVIWILMIIAHTALLVQVRKATAPSLS